MLGVSNREPGVVGLVVVGDHRVDIGRPCRALYSGIPCALGSEKPWPWGPVLLEPPSYANFETRFPLAPCEFHQGNLGEGGGQIYELARGFRRSALATPALPSPVCSYSPCRRWHGGQARRARFLGGGQSDRGLRLRRTCGTVSALPRDVHDVGKAVCLAPRFLHLSGGDSSAVS